VFRSRFQYLDEYFRVSVKAFYFYIPASILAVPLIFWREDLPASVPQLLSLGTLVTVLTFLVYSLLVYTSRKFAQSDFGLLGILTLLLTGVIRGLLLSYTFNLIGYEDPISLIERLLTSIFNVSVWLGFGSILIENHRRFQRRYRAMLTQILVLKLRNNSDFQPGYSYIEEHIVEMQLRLKSSIEEIRSATDISSAETALAKKFRQEIDEELKPLNQRLWVKSAYSVPSLRFKEVLKTACAELKFNFHFTAWIFVGILVLNTIVLIGSAESLSYGLLSYIAFYFLNELRLLLLKRSNNKPMALNSFFLVLIGFSVGLFSTFILDILGFSHSYSAALLIAPVLPVLIITISFIQLALSDRETLIDILTRQTKNLNEDYMDKLNRGNAASYLHNSLQSELSSLAIHLDSISRNPDPFRSELVSQKIDSFISRSRREDFRDFLETPDLRLKRIIESWEGIASIDLSLDSMVLEDPSRASLVVQLIQEAIANAIRSGHANKIEITGTFLRETIKITVSDNGRAPLETLKRGVGSEWIDSIAVTEWNLERSDSGSVLTVEI
jgi:signal transduction histidine kinase